MYSIPDPHVCIAASYGQALHSRSSAQQCGEGVKATILLGRGFRDWQWLSNRPFYFHLWPAAVTAVVGNGACCGDADDRARGVDAGYYGVYPVLVLVVGGVGEGYWDFAVESPCEVPA